MDLSYRSIAEILGVPIGTVRSRIFHARRQVQAELRAYAIEMGYVRRSRVGLRAAG